MEIKPLSLGDQLRMMRGVEDIAPVRKEQPKAEKTQSNQPSFTDFLKDQFAESNKLGLESDRAIERSLNGDEANPHATMIALQKADISFKLMLNVSQKLIQAYQEIVRTPIG